MKLGEPLVRLFKDKTEVIIFSTAFLIEVTFGLYLIYRWGHTFVALDAVSHLHISRTVVGNGANSNFVNLGTVWLPMLHILVLPLILINPLYYTGFAGTIISALMTGGICVILYRLIGERRLGIVASTFYMCNIFTLMYGATAMMEQTAIFFIMLAVYYFKSYWEKDEVTEFMKCSLALIFGTLTRYEVWVVALLVIFLFGLRELRNGQGYRLAYIHLPLWGIFAWLFWNLAIFKDPLMFVHGYPWAAVGDISPSLWLAIDYMTQQVYETSGLLCLLAFSSIVFLLIRKRASKAIIAILLVSPIIFHFSQPILGFLGLAVGWTSNVFTIQSRYFYMGLLGLLVASLLPVETFKKSSTNSINILIPFICISLIATAYPRQLDILISGNASGIEFETNLRYINEVRSIKELVGDQTILISSHHKGGLYSVSTKTPPYLIIDDFDGPLYLKTQDEPWNYCSFVLINKISSDVLGFETGIKRINEYYGGKYFIYRYYNDDSWRSSFLKHYKLITETNSYLLYQLIDES